MRDFEFQTPVKVIFGKNKLSEIGKLCKKKKVLLVYGGQSLKINGTYDQLISILNEAEAEVVEYGGQVSSDLEKNKKGIQVAKDHHVETVIGIGGAIVMDMAKVIAFGAVHSNLETYLEDREHINNNDKLTTILVPTYPSTGSETDSISDIEDARSLHGVYADYAILDPTLTFTLNQKNTAYSALVTFIQASVYYLSNDNEIAKGFGEVILKNILNSYERLLNNPYDYDARGNIMWAAALTTMSITDIGLKEPYVWSVYDVGAYPKILLGVGYREGVTMMFPQWLKYISKKHYDDLKEFMVRILGVNENLNQAELIEEGCEVFRNLLRKGGIPVSYAYYDEIPDQKRLEEVAEQNTMEEFTKAEIIQMIKENYLSR